ncbi:signal transduction histidine kinase [Roseiarcus fermentans]|uniref:histidine kinase n=1 Tax=Roseiarcus fermentans TaxID=1473586 RepID=A0A366FDY0_9HYPH|nr:HAMP domain-containing sensor histidine kinase [Roseiarcus fermentans]RBP12883.1 signal transduction histidine kinase [Roseiarcus fermentans]
MLDLPTRGNRASGVVSTAAGFASARPAQREPDSRARFGLAGRVLVVTIGFALLAMGLFYVARLASYRETWLHNKITVAQTALEAFDAVGSHELSPDIARKVLESIGLKAIVVSTPSGRRTVSASPQPAADISIDPTREAFLDSVGAAFRTLAAGRGQVVAVTEATAADGGRIEVTLDETPLVAALWRVSNTFLNIALLIATVVASVLWTALWIMVLRPMRRLTSNIIAFGQRPQDVSRIIAPSGRDDEIGRAEKALAAMQKTLAHELAQRKRMAELGLAVARINHDLRNILSAAQLISDRLATIPDPQAQRLAPRLVATLDRAIQFCQTTLTYGAGSEQPPERRPFDLNKMVQDVAETARDEHGEDIDYHVDIPPRFEVYADPDHILRVLENLSRNAAQALLEKGVAGGRPKSIRFAAIRTDGEALIEISDTGPGFPPDRKERIFEPFQKSTSQAGTGLGLSIAADLVTRNGGCIDLAPAKADDFYCGARFLIKLPTPERAALTNARPGVEA